MTFFDRSIGARLDRLQAHLSKFTADIERRMLGLELRDDQRNAKLQAIEGQLSTIDTKVTQTNGRVTELEEERIRDEATRAERQRQLERREHEYEEAVVDKRWRIDTKVAVLVALGSTALVGLFSFGAALLARAVG